MTIQAHLPLLEALIDQWREALGPDRDAYRHHVYRVVHFCRGIRPGTEDELRKFVIAAVFHDLGLWTARTLDYLPPSIGLARQWLDREGLADWFAEIAAMIAHHHAWRPVPHAVSPLVDVFRRADWVDVSLGLGAAGLPRAYVRRVQRQFPGLGFHRGLARRWAAWVVRHPLRPLPFVRSR